MSKSYSNKKYDHSEVIGKQVKDLGQVITKGVKNSEDGGTDFTTYYNRVIMGIMHLDSLLDPFKDDEFEDHLKGFNPKNMSRAGQLKFIRECMSEYTNLMNRQGLFYVQYSTDEMGSVDKESDNQ